MVETLNLALVFQLFLKTCYEIQPIAKSKLLKFTSYRSALF
jgi:hypothetical protein